MPNSELQVFFRCDPKTPTDHLKKIKQVSPKAILWGHGGKFEPEGIQMLGNKASESGLRFALDIGQKTRVTKIDQPEAFNDHESGRVISANQRVVLVDPATFDNKLGEVKLSVSDAGAIFVRLNRFPPAGGAGKGETGIVFGDGETLCVIDPSQSKLDQGYWVTTVTQTSNSKIYSNNGLAGQATSFEADRSELFLEKDKQCLDKSKADIVDFLIVSFVVNQNSIDQTLALLSESWSGWKENPSRQIIWKLETLQTTEPANLERFLAVPNSKCMLGLGDFAMACKYGGREFENEVENVLRLFDQHQQKIILAGHSFGLWDKNNKTVRPMPAEQVDWLGQMLSHNCVDGIGLTSEAVSASQRGFLPELMEQFIAGINQKSKSV